MQQSSSYRSPVPKKEHKYRCQPGTTVRETLSSQFRSSPKNTSMKSVSSTTLKAEKAGLWQTPRTLCQEDSWLLMLPCDGFQVSRIYQQARCLFRFRAKMSRALNTFGHAGRTSICPNSMSCHQKQFTLITSTSTHAGVKQWPLQEIQSPHSFYVRKASDQWRAFASQCKAENEGLGQTPQTLC